MIAPLRRPDPPRPSHRRRRASETLRKARQIVAERLLPSRAKRGSAPATRRHKAWLAVAWLIVVAVVYAVVRWR